MQTIILKNFKSYENQIVHNFNPRINVILGKNGQGKSNLFKGLSFLMSDKISLNPTEWNNCRYKGIAGATQDPIEVEIILEEPTAQKSLWRLSRVWKSESQQVFYYDDNPIPKSDFEGYFQHLGFRYENPYNIVQQGKITEVAAMDEHQLFKLLEEATGIKKNNEKRENSYNSLIKARQTREQLKQTLLEYQEKLKQLNVKKEQFQNYELEEKIRMIKSKKIFEEKNQKIQQELKGLTKEYQIKLQKAQQFKKNQKQLKDQLDNISSQIKAIQKKINFYQNQSQGTLTEIQHQTTQAMKQKQSKIKKLSSTIQQKKNMLNKLNQQVSTIKEQYQIVQKKYQVFKNYLKTEKDTKNKKDTIKMYEQQIQLDKQRISDINNQIKKFQQINKAKNANQNHLNNLKELAQCEKKKQEILKDSKKNKISLIELNRQKNFYQAEIQLIKSQKNMLTQKIRRTLPLVDFHLLEVLKKHKIPGVYGYFLEFLQIDDNLLNVYQAAGLHKLCSIIVQNQQVCQTVIQFNKKINGRQINLIPLTYIRTNIIDKKSAPNSNQAHSLLNQQWIKIKLSNTVEAPLRFVDDLEKLVRDTFGKHLLVENYDHALKYSRQYHMNCITSSGEIVYSEGYLCKVGFDENNEECRSDAFKKYMEKSHSEEAINKKLKEIEKNLIQAQNLQMEISRSLMKNQQNQRNIRYKLNQNIQEIKVCQKIVEEEMLLKNIRKKAQENIRNKQQMIKNLKTKKNTTVNPEEFKHCQRQMNEKRRLIESNLDKVFCIQQQIVKLERQDFELKEQLSKMTQNRQLKVDNATLTSKADALLKLKKQKKYFVERIQILTNQLQKIPNELQILQSKSSIFMERICLLQNESKMIKSKLQQISKIPEAMQIQQQSISMSHSLSLNQQNRKNNFTLKDKIFFSKFVEVNKKLKEFQDQYIEIQNAENELNKLHLNIEQQTEDRLKQYIKSFSTHFNYFFKRITLRGQSKVSHTKITQKVRGVIKLKNCLNIQVSFSAVEKPFQKWQFYSGGQRTVISTAIIMALQKCQPAPFYVFDQIDSALDKFYSERILQLIAEESQHAQYFITSFKASMMQFSEDICNYYLVQNIDRKSIIQRVAKNNTQIVKILNQ